VTPSPRFASVISCNTRHAGQIEYLRGLVKHQGWFPAAEKSSIEQQCVEVQISKYECQASILMLNLTSKIQGLTLAGLSLTG